MQQYLKGLIPEPNTHLRLDNHSLRDLHAIGPKADLLNYKSNLSELTDKDLICIWIVTRENSIFTSYDDRKL